MMQESKGAGIGGMIVLIGIALIFAGIFFEFINSNASGSTSVGGVIFIGPFPIVFGAGPGYQYILPIAIAIALIMIVLSFFYYRQSSREKEKLQ